MSFIRNMAVKKELKNLYDNANLIYQETAHSLQASTNVYYHYSYVSMRMTNQSQQISLEEIELSLTTFESYLRQLQQISKEIVSILKENPRLTAKFFKYKEQLDQHFKTLFNSVNFLINNIREINDYQSYPELKLIFRRLIQFKQKILSITNSISIENYVSHQNIIM